MIQKLSATALKRFPSDRVWFQNEMTLLNKINELVDYNILLKEKVDILQKHIEADRTAFKVPKKPVIMSGAKPLKEIEKSLESCPVSKIVPSNISSEMIVKGERLKEKFTKSAGA